MEFSNYYKLLNKVENKKNEYEKLLYAIKNLEKIVASDRVQTVETRITNVDDYGRSYSDPINANAKNLLKYYKSELIYQKQQYDILVSRINNTRLQ